MSVFGELGSARRLWLAGEITIEEYTSVIKRTAARRALDIGPIALETPSVADNEDAADLRWYHGRVL